MSFKDGRIGIGKTPIFPLDISGSCRIEGDLILGGRFSDINGDAIQLGGGSGTATSVPDQTNVTLPSWSGGTIGTQGLGVFKGVLDADKNNILISGFNNSNASTTGTGNTTCGWATGYQITSSLGNTLIGHSAGLNLTNSSGHNVCVGQNSMSQYNVSYNTCIGWE